MGFWELLFGSPRGNPVDGLLGQLAALVHQRDWDGAEKILSAPPFLDEEQAAAWADVHAQVRLGRGDLDGALAVLEAAEPVPKTVRAQVEWTRLRVLAARGRDNEVVWNRMRAMPVERLRTLARQHADEPAGRIAHRIADGGAYR